MNEVDYRSFVKGFITGTVVLAGVCGVVYIVQMIKK